MTLEEKLGFDKIREMLAGECSNQLALRMTQGMTFLTNYEKVLRELRQTEEMRQIVMFASSFPSQDFVDMTEELARLKVENTVIDVEELLNLKVSLSTLRDVLRFFHDSADDRNESGQPSYPALTQLAERVEWDDAVLRSLNKIVDDKGEIYDTASSTLNEIRQRMRRKRIDVDLQISKTLAHAKREGWAPEDAEATIRDGRMVIPMLDTHRRKIKGLIHDESATRRTAYLEPSEVVELNNDLRELEFDERKEIIRILTAFSDLLRPQLGALLSAYWFLARIDFIRAKARLALRLNAGMPIVNDAVLVEWLDARHPLLVLDERVAEVVPFNMKLDNENHILIISGPNAGGKSVCLKAVGLIQYMLQCGLLVPCRETSEFGVFESVFIDIGDQQSIADDLSTYTSHLQNMKALLARADEKTLFLLDELGGGTEPRAGCAIAEALLEELCRRHSFGVVTTHFADLKLLADKHPGIVNGAMLFDTERMRPRYMLAIGHPGSSFAFEIAANIGFPADVLEAASQKVGAEMLNFEHQLQQMELDKQEIARQKEELAVADSFLAEVVEKYQRLNEKLEAKKYDIISQARAEAKQILTDANRTVEQTISDIKTAQAEKEQTAQARERLRDKLEEVKQKEAVAAEKRRKSKLSVQQINKSTTQQSESDVVDGEIAVGDIVKIVGQESYGEVVELKGKKAVIESNSLRMRIAVENLQKTRKKVIPADKSKKQESRFQSIFDDINEKRKYFNPTLDLRGQRAEDALSQLDHFLDEAQLLGEKELRILHGKGYGILKTLIRERLQHNHDVQSFRSERLELGGDGITVVNLK